jgi:hypothetical protein
MAAFVYSNSILLSEEPPGLQRYRNHNETKFTNIIAEEGAEALVVVVVVMFFVVITLHKF